MIAPSDEGRCAVSEALLCNQIFTGLTQVNLGKLAEGVRTLREGSSTSEKNNDLFWLGRFPNCVGWVYHEALDFERALAINEEAMTIARQTGFLEGEANSAVNVGLASIELGELERARTSFLQAEEIFGRDDWFKWRYRLRLDNGWSDLYARLGDLAQARSHASNCQKSAQSTGSRKHLALAHRQLGRIALLENNVADAEKHLNKAIDLTSDLQAPLAAWRSYLSAAELYDATHRSDQAATSRATALQILKNLAENADEETSAAILQSKTVRDLGG
jgi:tetratricopeptide (TPR) repeat protein